MSTTPLKQGFTLTELTISIGIFLIIFTLFTQGFLTVMKIAHTIDVHREMTLYSSKILGALNGDIDSYILLSKDALSKDTSIQLQNIKNSQTISYTLRKITNGEKEALLQKKRAIEKIPEEVFVLEKTDEQGNTSPFISENFVLTNASFHKSPGDHIPNPCNFPPSVTFRANVYYIPLLSNTTPPSKSSIQTTFTTPMDPTTYSSTCT